MSDCKTEITSKLQDAFQQKQALQIKAGNTKPFYGRKINAEPLSLARHTGIIEYEPSELYLTARSGTSLLEIEQAVADQNQILPCEPPHFGAAATLGGMIACGLAGPRRVIAGNVRDCVLGTEILNGKGEVLRFGGKVMKNVAGYDVSRLMCGALGTLGVLMSVSLRLLPKPSCEQTIALTVDGATAIIKMNQWANTPMPISATYYDGSELYVRLSSSASAVEACKNEIGGHQTEEHEMFWTSIKEQTHAFFSSDMPLWRISIPPNTPTLNLPGASVMEWNGALRWYKSDAEENIIRSEAKRVGGHANLFKGNITDQVFHPIPSPSMKLHKKLKQALDPAGILNPGKMFAEL
ncbi:MAG: glycolate oxidase subunit GlcE [Gammaproteobacteria bacterium]|nr:MAG: glycolate oxidase subunit GlcE [Gammaproteobacteria bacterium]